MPCWWKMSAQLLFISIFLMSWRWTEWLSRYENTRFNLGSFVFPTTYTHRGNGLTINSFIPPSPISINYYLIEVRLKSQYRVFFEVKHLYFCYHLASSFIFYLFKQTRGQTGKFLLPWNVYGYFLPSPFTFIHACLCMCQPDHAFVQSALFGIAK